MKTKGGMRFVTPSGKKPSVPAGGGVSSRAVVSMNAQPKVTLTTISASTASAAAAAAAAARASKQSATVTPTSQLAKVQ